MKNKFKIALLNLSVFALMVACTKENSETPSSVTPDPMISFLSNHADPVQHFSFDAATGGTFICSNGIRLTFSANSFLNQSNAVVTGTVNLEVKEFVSKQDLIYNRVSTISHGVPLISGGAFWFNAKQNGTELKMAPGKTCFAIMPPQKNNQQMYLYSGDGTTDNSFGLIDWSLEQDPVNEITDVPYDSVSSYLYVTTRPNGTSSPNTSGYYVNCDYPTDTVVGDSLKVTSTDAGWEYCTTILVSMRSNFSLTSVSVIDGESVPIIYPTGAALEIAAFYKKGNEFYLSHKFTTSNGQLVILPTFIAISEEDLVAYLNTL